MFLEDYFTDNDDMVQNWFIFLFLFVVRSLSKLSTPDSSSFFKLIGCIENCPQTGKDDR
jgi:hypothetical protein